MIADTFSYQFNVYRTKLTNGYEDNDVLISRARGTGYGPNAYLDPLDKDYDAFYRSGWFLFSGSLRESLYESGVRVFGNSFTHRPTVKYLERLMKRFDELAVEHNWIIEDPSWFPNGSGFDWKVYYGGYPIDISPSSGVPYSLTGHRLNDDRFWRYFYQVSNYVYDKTTAICGSHVHFINDRILYLTPTNGEIGGDYKSNYQLRFSNLEDYDSVISSRFPMIDRTDYDLYDNYEYSSGVLGVLNNGNGIFITDKHGALPSRIPDVFWNPDGSGHLLLHQYSPQFEKLRYLTYSGLETQYRMSFTQCGAFDNPITLDSSLGSFVDSDGDGSRPPLQKLYSRYLGHAIPVSGSSFNYTFPPEHKESLNTVGLFTTTTITTPHGVVQYRPLFNSGIVYNTVPSLFSNRWFTVQKSIDRVKTNLFAIETLDTSHPFGFNGWLGTTDSDSDGDGIGDGIPLHDGPSGHYTLTLLTPASGLSDYITEIETDFNNSKWCEPDTSTSIPLATTANTSYIASRKGDWLGSLVSISNEENVDEILELEPFIGNNDRIFIKKDLYHNVFPSWQSTTDITLEDGSIYTRTNFLWDRLAGGVKEEEYEISMNSSFSFMLLPVSLRGLHLTAFSHLGVHHKLNDHYLNDNPQSLRSLIGLKQSDLYKLFLSYYLKPQTRMPNLEIYKNLTFGSTTDLDNALSIYITGDSDGDGADAGGIYTFNNLLPIINVNGGGGSPYGVSIPIDVLSNLYNTFINSVEYDDLELVYGYIDVVEEIDRPNFELLGSGNILDYHESFSPRPFVRPLTNSTTSHQTVFASGTYISDVIAQKLENNEYTNIFDLEIPTQDSREFNDHIEIIQSGAPLLPSITFGGDHDGNNDPDSQRTNYNIKANDLKYTNVLKNLDFPYSGWFDTIPPSGSSHMFIAIKPRNRSSFLATPNYINTTTVYSREVLHSYSSGALEVNDEWQNLTHSCNYESNAYGEHVGGAYIKSNTVINNIGIPTFMRSPKSGELFPSVGTQVSRDMYYEIPNNEYISNSGLLYGSTVCTSPQITSPTYLTSITSFQDSELGSSAKIDHWWRYGACKMLYDMRQIDPYTNNLASIFDRFWVTTDLNLYGLGSGCKRDELHTPATFESTAIFDKINGNMAALLFKQNGHRYQPVPINPFI